jgi:glycosyltransferase involved in cell wall biosynthesis
MKIDLICNDGSPLGVIPPMIYGRGVGGAELAMMSLMEILANRGHDVAVYNDPQKVGSWNGVSYKPRGTFKENVERDAVIIFRSPNPLVTKRCVGKKIWWSCDQRTVGSFQALANQVDFIVCISPYHVEYFHRTYVIPYEKMAAVDLGVRLQDYQDDVEKIPGRMIYCSIPDRGLDQLLAAWPLIKRDAPDATLVITADYTLWGGPPANHRFRLSWAAQKGVTFLGAIPRRQLCKKQQEAELQIYPSIYDELFCISAAECQVAGAFPITSQWGALPTTNQFGISMPGDPRSPSFVESFAKKAAMLVTVDHEILEARREIMKHGARNRFDWNVIAESWEKIFKEGKLK